MMAKEKCPACGGKGNDGYHKEEGTCHVCMGTGMVDKELLAKPAKKKRRFRG
jgi:RecJ-like exonuclease